MKKVVIIASNGFIGTYLSNYFVGIGWSVVKIARVKNHPEINYWDGESPGDWENKLENADVVINLSGKSVNWRYTKKNQNSILSSRINSTKAIGDAILKCKNPPKMWINFSTATIYEDTRGKKPSNDDKSRSLGSDFSMNVAKQWENTFLSYDTPNTIKTVVRSAIVFGKFGGAFPVIGRLAKFGLNTKQADGEQWISWIHIEDLARSLEFIIFKKLSGLFNLASPTPIKNRDFFEQIRKIIKPIFSIPQPKFLLKIGAFIMGTETELILKSRKIAPRRLIENNFLFKHSKIRPVLIELL